MALVITGGGSPITMLKVTATLGPVPAALVADITVLVKPTGPIDVPEISPVAAFKVNPAGNGDAK